MVALPSISNAGGSSDICCASVTSCPVTSPATGITAGRSVEVSITAPTRSPLVGVCNTLWYRPDDYYAVPWRGRWETELGGVSMCLGIHLLDLLLFLLGESAGTRRRCRQPRC